MKRWLWLAPIALLILGAVTYFRRPSEQQKQDRELANAFSQEKANAIRAGLPMNTHGFQAPSPPASQDAAPLYNRLMQELKAALLTKDETDAIALKRNVMPTTEQWQAVRGVLQQHPGLVALVHQAASRPKCVFVRNWRLPNPADLLLPEYAPMRQAARLLTSESLLMAQDGHPLDAVRNLALDFQVARHAASEPTMISYLVGLAIDAITFNGLQKILYLAGDKPEVAQAVQKAIEQHWKSRSLAFALRGEIGFNMGMLEVVRHDGPKGIDNLTDVNVGSDGQPRASAPPNLFGDTSHPRYTPAEWNLLMDANGTLLLRWMRREIAAADRPFPQADAEMSAIAQEIEKDKSGAHILPSILFPVYNQSAAKRAQIQAQAEVVRIGAALLVYKARHGTFPPTLDAAVSPVPLDPFDGKPLRYRLEGDGFAVYSVGKDGVFDGGSSDQRPNASEVVFRYPLPVYRP